MALDRQGVDQALNGLHEEWAAVGVGTDDAHLERVLAFDDFAAAMTFVNELADVAEELNHHPDITINYNRVTLHISNHEQGGISDQCVTLAGRVDRLAG